MAWWLAYQELYGDMDKEYPIMKQKEKEKDVTILGGDTDDTITFTSDSVGAADTISIDFGSASPDTVNIGTPLPGGMGEDHIVTDTSFCKRLVDWGDIIRKTFYDGGIEEIISTRRLVHILRAYSIFNDKAKAIKVCINRFDDETKQAFLELYDKVDVDFDLSA